jgi:hypothetical protein
VTFILFVFSFSFVLLLRLLDFSCDVHLCSLLSAYANLTINKRLLHTTSNINNNNHTTIRNTRPYVSHDSVDVLRRCRRGDAFNVKRYGVDAATGRGFARMVEQTNKYRQVRLLLCANRYLPLFCSHCGATEQPQVVPSRKRSMNSGL